MTNNVNPLLASTGGLYNPPLSGVPNVSVSGSMAMPADMQYLLNNPMSATSSSQLLELMSGLNTESMNASGFLSAPPSSNPTAALGMLPSGSLTAGGSTLGSGADSSISSFMSSMNQQMAQVNSIYNLSNLQTSSAATMPQMPSDPSGNSTGSTTDTSGSGGSSNASLANGDTYGIMNTLSQSQKSNLVYVQQYAAGGCSLASICNTIYLKTGKKVTQDEARQASIKAGIGDPANGMAPDGREKLLALYGIHTTSQNINLQQLASLVKSGKIVITAACEATLRSNSTQVHTGDEGHVVTTVGVKMNGSQILGFYVVNSAGSSSDGVKFIPYDVMNAATDGGDSIMEVV